MEDKIKIFSQYGSISKLETEVNEFMLDKNVINVSLSQDVDEYLTIVVLYKEVLKAGEA